MDLNGNLYDIKSKVQRLNASSEDSGGSPIMGLWYSLYYSESYRKVIIITLYKINDFVK